jgi:outer membrane lipoprotein-sorting protein
MIHRIGRIALLAVIPGWLHAQSARDIVEHVDRMTRGASSRAELVMEVVTAHWSRSLTLKVWSLGTDYALVRVMAPLKEAGTATLMVNKEVWNYLPRVDRTIKVPPSLMMGSWMGSHLTNDDLVKESQLVTDYDIGTAFTGAREGEAVWEFRLTPKPDAAVVWGRIDVQVRQRDSLPVWMKYYDDQGTLARTIRFSDYRVFDGRRVPAQFTVVPADKPGEHTTLRYESLSFDVGLTPAFFSLRNLRGHP